jgi:hypothetical protein
MVYSERPQVFYSFEQYNLSLSPQVLYHLYNKANFKIYLGAGVAINASQYRHNSLMNENWRAEAYRNYYQLEPLWINFNFRNGVLIGKRLELFLMHSTASAYTTYAAFSISTETFSGGINYSINRGK